MTRRPPLHWHPVRATTSGRSPIVYELLIRADRPFGAVQRVDGTWRATGYAETGASPHTNAALGLFTTQSAAKSAVRGWATRVETGAPPCGTCGGPTLWADDAWTCRRCGDEWDGDHSPLYAVEEAR